jgi:hypothetical protein
MELPEEREKRAPAGNTAPTGMGSVGITGHLMQDTIVSQAVCVSVQCIIALEKLVCLLKCELPYTAFAVRYSTYFR